MKFLIQHNLINPDHLLEIKYAIEKYPHEFVGVLPFSHEITSDEPIEGTDYIPYGSTLFTTLTHSMGFKGNYFDLSRFNYGAFLENRDDMLNDNVMSIRDAITFLEAQPEDIEWFTRPSNDLKEYVGMVETAGHLTEWFNKAVDSQGSNHELLTLDTKVDITKPTDIQAE